MPALTYVDKKNIEKLRKIQIADSDNDSFRQGDTKSNHSTFIGINKIHIFVAQDGARIKRKRKIPNAP